MAFYTIVKRLPKNVTESPWAKGLYRNDKFVYEQGVSEYTGEKVYYRHKRLFV